ncbi:V-type ATP synthase subunit I [Candidatus Woesearchaeota archaeon]|nr:MAG: V-type ATP synthase subunit I [Candidatus Woesearchaeota archaeon]
MIRSEDMVKVTLFMHKSERERVISELHKLGIMQLLDVKEESLTAADPGEDLRTVSDLLVRVAHCKHILTIPGQKKKFLQQLLGLETLRKARVKRSGTAGIIREARAFLRQYEQELLRLEATYEERIELLAARTEEERLIRELHEQRLPVALLHDTQRLAVRVARGTTMAAEAFVQAASAQQEVHVETRVSGKEALVVLITLKEHTDALTLLMKKHGLVLFAVPKVPVEKNALAWVQRTRAALEKELAQTTRAVARLQRRALDESIFLHELLELEKEKLEAAHKMRATQQVLVLQGWVTKREREKLDSIKGVALAEALPKKEESVPVKLNNNRFLRPFEILTELYALPKYKDLDPTFIVGPLFLVYAGFMLTDFVYGLGLVVLGAVLIALFRKYNRGITDISISIVGIGLFSMLFGVLTGSYLGDAPKALFGDSVLGVSTSALAIWKDPLAEPLYFLVLSLAVGLIHLNIGLVLGLIEDIRHKAWRTMLSERVLWWLLQLAVLAYVLHWGVFAHALLGLTVLVVLVLQGPLGLLGMTGFMGDVISYSRLFALALSTAGIAMTVNLLAVMLHGVPYVGFLLAALVFIGGHLFSFAMNALGSFVHSIRLQFVEFFGKFYEGGGDKFLPFKEERVYTEVAE